MGADELERTHRGASGAYLSLLYKAEHRAKPKYLVYIYFFTHKSPRSTEDRLCAKSEIHAEK